jgi:hypothetical protein
MVTLIPWIKADTIIYQFPLSIWFLQLKLRRHFLIYCVYFRGITEAKITSKKMVRAFR